MVHLYRGEYMNTVRIQKGFTLIELLIVIALLGSLAVGLLATIDPFEQLKKDAILPPEIQSQNFITQICVTTLQANFPWGTATTLTAAAVSGRGSDITSLRMPEN